MDKSKIGTRVSLIHHTDRFTFLKRGDLGTIEFVDDSGTVHVRWDSGSTLGLIPGEDSWEELPRPS